VPLLLLLLPPPLLLLLLLLLQELDEAARRRMPKQLYIPLPCAEARRQLILRQLGPGAKVAADLSSADLDKVGENFPLRTC
jgi:SpoVK/Ycf46/Vps4 family AAA+-type ATPase